MEAAGRKLVRRGAGQRAFLQGEVGVEIDLGCLDAFMAKPESDDGGVNASLQQVHRAGMAKHMGSDVLVAERAAGSRGYLAYLHRRCSTASRLSAAPRTVGNTGSPGSPWRSRIQ